MPGAQTPPVGTVALLFTDIEGSTPLARDLGPQWGSGLRRHREIVDQAITEHGGWVDSVEGDGFFATFSNVSAAAGAAVAAQHALQAEPWPGGVGQVRVRMGLHVGWLERTETGYVGLEIHRAARVGAAAHGGQVLLTEAARHLVGDWLPVDDLGLHRLKDFPAPAHLFCALIDGRGAADFPPPRTSGPVRPGPGRLPSPRTSLVGRVAELDKIGWLLERHRLVTVTGPGGSGKTRLVMEVGRRVGDRFADGVVWVDLSGVDQGDLVPATIAAVVGVQERAGDSMLGALVGGLSARQMLVVLDNCEQVAEAVAGTCERLLADCDDLWILATSTKALKVQGEARLRVSPLPVPAAGESLAEIVASEAVALFVERASAVDPDFTLTAGTEESVAEIVRRLDGMPLAVELAAARVSELGIGELLAGLDDRFAVLVENSRGAPVRQRSLLAALDWSYQLLPPADQTVFRKLAVFGGPFTLSAAAELCGADARAVIPRLVDCSLLVQPVEGGDGRSRYRMLETMRAHADRLLASDERASVADGLLNWAVSQPWEVQCPFEFTDQDYDILARIDAEQDNIRQAAEHAATNAAPARLLLEAMKGPWYFWRGRLGEGRAALQAALDACVEPTALVSATALFWLGYLEIHLGQIQDALLHLAKATEQAESGGHPIWRVASLGATAFAYLYIGRNDEAAGNAQMALELAREFGYREGLAYALYVQAGIAHSEGSYDVGLALAEQSEEAMGGLTEHVLGARAESYLQLQQYLKAEEASLAGLELARRRQNQGSESWAQVSLAIVYLRLGRTQEAGRSISDGLRLAWDCGELALVPSGLLIAAEISLRMRRPQDATALLAAGAAITKVTGMAITKSERDLTQLLSKELLEALGPEGFRVAHARGTSMTTPIAIVLSSSLATPDELSQSARGGVGDDSHTRPSLSQREQELLGLVAHGFTDAQIAQQLFISVRTVRSHLDRIRDKTGCRRRADLTRLALEAQLV